MKLKAKIVGIIFCTFFLGLIVAAEASTVKAQSPFNQWMYARYRNKNKGTTKRVTKTTKSRTYMTAGKSSKKRVVANRRRKNR